MKDKYSVNVFWDEEDNCFIATCHEFPLLSAHGDTKEEAISEFQVVLEMAIESYIEDHLELPKPKILSNYSGQFRIRMRKNLHKELAETAEKEGVSLNSYAVSVIAENHAIKKLYADKIEALERMINGLTLNIVSQHQELQVYTKKLEFFEDTARQDIGITNRWSSNNDQIIPATINRDIYFGAKEQ